MTAETGGLPAAGLDADELAGYELVIAAPSATLPELATVWGRQERLETVVAALEAKGFITRHDDLEPRYSAVDPEVALDSSLAEYEAGLQQARAHVQLLTARHHARSIASASSTLVEVVTGHHAVLQRLTQVLRAARDEIRCLHKVAYLDDLRTTEEELAALRRGIVCRTVYERASVERPGSLDDVERMLAAGLQGRVLPSLSIQLYLADRRYALLPLQLEPTGVASAVVVHPCALLDALRNLFDGLWDRALPLQRSDATVAWTTGRRVVDKHRLVTLLLSGLTDEAIARHLNIGYRTVQRHVAELLATLGARTRFQAGVQTALSDRNRSPGSRTTTPEPGAGAPSRRTS